MTSAELVVAIKKHPIGFVCGAVALISAGVIYYRSGETGVRQSLYDAKSAEAGKMVVNVRNAEKITQQTDEAKSLAKELDARLVRPAQLAVNLQYFYKLETETEVKLVDVKQNIIPKPSGKTLYAPVPYSVTVQGSFKQVMAFLQKLEAGPHFTRFNSVNFMKSTPAVEGPGMEVTDMMRVVVNLELLGVQ